MNFMDSLNEFEAGDICPSVGCNEFPVKPQLCVLNSSYVTVTALEARSESEPTGGDSGEYCDRSKESQTREVVECCEHVCVSDDKKLQEQRQKKAVACHEANIDQVFSIDKFSDPRDPPVVVGKVKDKITFSTVNHVVQCVEDLLLKVAGSGEYHLPCELIQFEEALRIIVSSFHSYTPHAISDYYCYLSCTSGVVPPTFHQRFKTIHADGLLGDKHRDPVTGKYSLQSDTIFTVCDALPTEFFVKSIDVSALNPEVHDYNKYFLKHIDETTAQVYHKPYEIAMFDAYALHRSPQNESAQDVHRNFLSINFAPRLYDNKHATRNLAAFKDLYNTIPLQVYPATYSKYLATKGYNISPAEYDRQQQIADDKLREKSILDDVNKKVLEGLREVIAKRDFVEALDLITKECKSWSSHASNLNKTHMAEVHHLEGTVYDSLGQYEQAVEAHNKANELITMEKRDAGSALLKIRSLTALGNTYRTMGRFNNALKSFSDVLSYCKLFIRDPNIDAIAIGNIGSTYRHMGRHEEALKQAFIYLDMVENQAGRAGNREDDVRNIAQGHSSIGTAMRLTGRYQESLDEQLNALAMILPFETEHKDFIPTIYGKIGHSYSALGDRDKANENYKLAIDKAVATRNALTVAVAYCNWFYFLLLPHETNISAVESPTCGESESDIESAVNYNQSCNILTADERTALMNCVQTLEEYKSPFEASARNSLGRFYFLMSFNSSTKPSGDAIDYQEESYRMHQAAYSLALKFNLPLQEGFARLGLANNHLFWAKRKGLDKKSNNEASVSHGKGSLLANQHSDHIRAAVAIMDNHVEGAPVTPTFTAAMAAATVGWMSDLQRIFTSGIDMTQYDSSGYTFYDYACMHNHQSEVLALMQANLHDVAVIEVLTSETSLKSILRTLVLEKFSGTKVSKEIRSIFALTMEQSINGEAIKTNAVEEESNATIVEVPSDKMRDCHKVFDHVRYVPFQTLESLGHIPHSGENVAVMSSEDERKDDMKCVFISHRWLRPHWCPGCLSKECGMEGYPDEADNRKWKMIIIAIHRTIEKFKWDPACVRVWIDYSCLDQNNFDRLMAGVHSLPIYVLASDVVISLPDENYFNRAWCLMEVMYARLSREGRKFPQRFDFLKEEEADDFILRPDDGKSELKNPREGQFTSEKDRRSIRFLELVARLVM